MCFGPELGLAGSVISAVGAYQQGQATAAAYRSKAAADEQNAKIASRQAEVTAQNGAQEEREMRQRGQAIAGAQKASFSANGLDIGAGSPLDLLSDTRYLNELDALAIRRSTANNVWQFQSEGVNYLNSASANRSAASNASTAGTIGAVGSLLNGATSYSYYKNKLNDGVIPKTKTSYTRGGISGIPGQYP